MSESDSLPALLVTLRGKRKVGDVADACGFSKSMVYGWEAAPSEGHYRRILPANLQTLLDHYGASKEDRARAWELLAAAPSSVNAKGDDETAERVA
jgi:hypothetical protein